MYPTGTHYELVINLATYRFGWFCTSTRETVGWWDSIPEAAKHKPVPQPTDAREDVDYYRSKCQCK